MRDTSIEFVARIHQIAPKIFVFNAFFNILQSLVSRLDLFLGELTFTETQQTCGLKCEQV